MIAAILNFNLKHYSNVGIDHSIVFLSLKTWICTPKLSFCEKYYQGTAFFGYGISQMVVMAVILDEKFSSARIWGTLHQGIKWVPE